MRFDAEATTREPLAVIGSACRFPGEASSPSKLWELLSKPRDVLKEFSPDRLNLKRFYHNEGDTHGATDVINKSYLLEEDSRLFDASFFGINPMEAAGMDPQQRILLETVYEAIEASGATLEKLKGSLTSVHVGVMTSDYANIQARDTETVAKYNATGSANSIMSNRISYVFDLKGPSETIDTACSSSLVALHNAGLALFNGDCDAALVAGVNLILDPAPYINESKLHMLSPDSRSRMWDKGANGYARGEGAGAVMIKTLSQALRDGDHIEGIIRATGVNSDGQSPGITMPYARTQTALIRQTYERAGLDPIRDRPQYFECHGTGTPAGDPVEARAISDAFIEKGVSPGGTDNPLYVGSIKTIIGHLEGGAGLAGVIKVLLALKNRVIPPNLHFNHINPAVAPFYGPLQIPTTPIPWPALPNGVPARASVNSFGFGGTNAHAILESFEDGASTQTQTTADANCDFIGPLVLSARSGASLLRSVEAHLHWLEENPSISLEAVSSVLQTRRSTHRVRTHFAGADREAVLASLRDFLDKNKNAKDGEVGHTPKLVNAKERSGILGVFTGQGAQWPSMGRHLLERSDVFRRTIQRCEEVLQSLPEEDRPTWSLREELTADASTSRIAEAALSQPLCTAVQLGLVDVLFASGFRFDAVVGHSSGEIAAVYASGIINLKGAMQISYYRGMHAKLASGPEGTRGGMLAAGLSAMQARDFIARPEFKGRIQLAACNAPRSVTLSGDVDAIAEVKATLDEENTFARALKVDTAYHSHHMLPCAEPYLASLLACDIEIKQPKMGHCVWNSSVRGDTQLLRGDLSGLKGQYWVDNMVRTVQFSQAIESSIWHGGPFDLVIEVGPHPALKGPTEQTLQASYGSVAVYTGLLSRNGHDVAALSAAMGVAWAQLGSEFVNFEAYKNSFYKDGQAPAFKMLKGLPSYSWDHDKVYWREGRLSRRFRLGKDSPHELLGRRTLDDNEHELRWRNVLKLTEMPWLRGHEVLSEVLLPGASYVSIAAEAARHLAKDGGHTMRLLEIENIEIMRPVVVPDNKDGVETLFTARVVDKTKDVVRAQFAYYVNPDETAASMLQTCKGDLTIYLKQTGASLAAGSLPPRDPLARNVTKIDTEQVYNLFNSLGLNYSGAFKGITEISRCLNYASTTSTWPAGALDEQYLLHPAVLDVAFQTLFVAKAHPASRQITSALLPSFIDRVRIDPSVQLVHNDSSASTKGNVETWAVSHNAMSLIGDLNIYDDATGLTFLQVEGLSVNMVGAQESSFDRSMFSKTVWGRDPSFGLAELDRDEDQDAKGLRMADAVERVALFYVKRLVDAVPQQERENFIWYHQSMFEAFEEHLRVVQNGDHPIIHSDWLDDDVSVIDRITDEHGDEVDIKLLHAVGNNLADVVRGKTQLLEVMTKDDMLNRFYMDGYASIATNKFVADTLRQLTFKFPRAKILEIGAGTGGTSWSILNAIENAYDSYTYTDISSGFFPNATEKFAKFVDKMSFKVLNIESDPSEQGFEPHSYDIIVAALVLHATHDLERTLRNARSLLKPGGYLVMMELTGTMSVRATFIMGGLEGWWLGKDDGRIFSPLVTAVEWDTLLETTGYSGADRVVYDLPDEAKHCTSLIVSQAVNDDFFRLREPLSFPVELPQSTEPLVIVGGKKLWTRKTISEIRRLVIKTSKRPIQTYETLDQVELAALSPNVDTIVVQDMDLVVFSTRMTQPRIERLQSLLMNSKNMLWISPNAEAQNPRSSLIQGILRVAPSELPHLTAQHLSLSLELPAPIAASRIVESYVRLARFEDVVGHEKTLWAHEPELEITADGQTLIPRVIPDENRNSQYNASKRSITKALDARRVPVRAYTDHDRIALRRMNTDEIALQESTMQVQFTGHIPGDNGESAYLAYGTVSDESYYLVLSNVNSSVIQVNRGMYDAISAHTNVPALLSGVTSELLAHAVAGLVPGGQAILLFEADDAFASAIRARAEESDLKLFFASARSDAPDGWIQVHEFSTHRALQRKLPQEIRMCIDCSGGSSALSVALESCLPGGCRVRLLGASVIRSFARETNTDLGSMVREAFLAFSARGDKPVDQEVLSVQTLSGTFSAPKKTSRYITDWRKRDAVNVKLQPQDAKFLFHPDKTYFMAGMAGGLGLSICEWMIRNGAKYLVIASRRPDLPRDTLDEARRAGAKIYTVAMDLTNLQAVEAAVREVKDSMPPIAGVCNAAMILKDGFFIDMDADQLNGTLDAKVLGTENLDAVFRTANLDFFICLGSVASVIGNVGQSNYHAANLFMESFVRMRRSRGDAASLIHIAYVTDVGYVTREERDRQLDSHFKKVRLMPTSETDVHHAFAEAIKGGKVGSTPGDDVIIMGIEPLNEPLPMDQRPLWMKDTRFAHFTPPSSLQAQQDGGGAGTVNNVRQAVEEADSEEQAAAAVSMAFAGKLETMLQLSSGSINVQRPIIELGIDSLVAVEIRTWFLKELGADVPVVKILAGDTVEQISVLATKKMLAAVSGKAKSSVTKEPKEGIEKKRPTSPALDATTSDALDTSSSGRSASPVDTPNSSASDATDENDVTTKMELRERKELPDTMPGSAAMVAAAETAGSETPSQGLDKASDFNAQQPRSLTLQKKPNTSSTSRTERKQSFQGARARPVFAQEQVMSPAQSRMWFISKHEEDATAYNMVFRYGIKGRINPNRLRHALTVTAHQHESLRSCFYLRPGDGQPMQGVLAAPNAVFTHKRSEAEHTADDEMQRLVNRVWDLEQGIAFELSLLTEGPDNHVCFLAYHHIVMDVAGLGVILQDLDKTYRMQLLGPKPASYLEYSLQQQTLLKNNAFARELSFWRSEFATSSEPLPLLPMAKTMSRPASPGNQSHHKYVELSAETLSAVKAACQRLRISPFHFHLSVLQILLARLTGQQDICIGVVDANRGDLSLAKTVGYFVNMLPLRARICLKDAFSHAAKETSMKALQVLNDHAVPFDILLDAVKPVRVSEHAPLFQVALNYRMGSIWEMPMGECTMRLQDVKDASNPFDLSLGIAETLQGCVVELYGLTSLYDESACATILGSYVNLLEAFAIDPELDSASPPMYDATSVHCAIEAGKGRSVSYEWPGTLSQRWLDIVQEHASDPAVNDTISTATYGQLHERAIALALTLEDSGVSCGSQIAVLCEPSLDSVVSLLAILHLGAVYVPLDVSLPASRHRVILKSCEPMLLIIHGRTEQRARDLWDETGNDIQTLSIESVRAASRHVPCSASEGDAAILLFTSGSTGTPKGIRLSQANFMNHLALKTEYLMLGKERVLQQSSLGFDMSLVQIFCALANGGQVVIAPSEMRRDPVELTRLMKDHSISLTIATPSEYTAWLRYGNPRLDGWRHACMGGEQVPGELKRAFRRLQLPDLQLLNCYGPTEITAAATFATISHDKDSDPTGESRFAVGKALPNYSLSILDAAGTPQPIGYIGEICVSGKGVALGYLHPEKPNQRRFIVNAAGDRAYRTGDKGRLGPDGTLYCYGRLDGDTQIKLRGIRVELEEIETAILTASNWQLSSAVVTRREDVLVAHATLSDDLAELTAQLRQEILGRVELPQYFVPVSLTILDQLPINANGKVDRKAIAELAAAVQDEPSGVGTVWSEKMTVRQGELRLLWERVLPGTDSQDRITTRSDFFERGGNSMLLMKLQAAIQETMSIQVTTRTLYQSSTLRDMADSIDRLRDQQTAIEAESEIDWAVETAVPEWLRTELRTSTSKRVSKSGRIEILLTGATEFLGSHLLQSLLQSDHVGKVHCVAVRGDDEKLLPSSKKILCYPGSLLAPQLGLSKEEQDVIRESVDLFIHAGSSGHCLNTYPSLRTPNVLSTHFLASLAAPLAVPFMFVSSNRVALLSAKMHTPPGSLRNFHPPTSGDQGHMASRWASEVFLENLIEERKHISTGNTALAQPFVVSVHRPAVIVSDQAPNSDALNAILRHSVSMQCVPHLDRVEGFIDLVNLNNVVSELSETALSLASQRDGSKDQPRTMEFTHHSGNKMVPASKLRSHLAELYNIPFAELEMGAWLERAAEDGMDPLILAYMGGILESDAPMLFPYLGE